MVDKIVLNIEGMSCQHCVNRVKGALEELDGVNSVSVNLDDDTAEITYDSSKVDLKKFKEVVVEAGYEVK